MILRMDIYISLYIYISSGRNSHKLRINSPFSTTSHPLLFLPWPMAHFGRHAHQSASAAISAWPRSMAPVVVVKSKKHQDPNPLLRRSFRDWFSKSCWRIYINDFCLCWGIPLAALVTGRDCMSWNCNSSTCCPTEIEPNPYRAVVFENVCHRFYSNYGPI